MIVFWVFRYVDDYLVVFKPKQGSSADLVSELWDTSREYSGGLWFTNEVPTKKALQFSDLNICLEQSHPCWAYEPRTKKSFLSYESMHWKVVKRGIAKSCLRASLLKSCVHRSCNNFLVQVDRLTKAGFPKLVIMGVAESLLKFFRNPLSIPDNVRQKPASRPVVIPYLHSFAHRIKKSVC